MNIECGKNEEEVEDILEMITNETCKVDHLHSELGHARMVTLVSLNNSFHYKQGQKKLMPM
jgi:hypothetical protein